VNLELLLEAHLSPINRIRHDRRHRSFRPIGHHCQGSPASLPRRLFQELLGKSPLVHLVIALDDMAVRGDEPIRVEDEAAARLVERLGTHLVGRPVPQLTVTSAPTSLLISTPPLDAKDARFD